MTFLLTNRRFLHKLTGREQKSVNRLKPRIISSLSEMDYPLFMHTGVRMELS